MDGGPDCRFAAIGHIDLCLKDFRGIATTSTTCQCVHGAIGHPLIDTLALGKGRNQNVTMVFTARRRKLMIARAAIGALGFLLISTEANAMCRDDLKDLKPRIDHMKTVSKGRYDAALKWWTRAQQEEPGSETACTIYLARAKKALFEPLPDLTNCYGPNAYLPQCQNGAQAMGGPGFAPPGLGNAGGGGGGGGGGGAVGPVGPVGPVTGGATPFQPPGSVRARDH